MASLDSDLGKLLQDPRLVTLYTTIDGLTSQVGSSGFVLPEAQLGNECGGACPLVTLVHDPVDFRRSIIGVSASSKTGTESPEMPTISVCLGVRMFQALRG